jgi:CMP-N-acetylneuraminic acid synthetase
LVGRAVAAARGAATVHRIVGSTDDAEIADEMRRAGADVPVLRPSELAGDDVGDSPVFLHMLDVLETQGYRPDVVVNVRPTAPLRTAADIDGAVAALVGCSGARSVKSVSEASEHPYKMWTLAADGLLTPLVPSWHEAFGGDPDTPRQLLEPVYRSNGAVDAVRTDALRATGLFHPGPVLAYVMDARRAVDIDDVADLALADRVLADGSA